MSSNYYEEQRAKINIMGELVRRGWKVYGYKPDQSDSMSDYFNPAYWEGIAEKDGAVICVAVSGTAYSGKKDRNGELCPTFQANPPRSKWHVERNGQILAKGIGLSACQDANEHQPKYQKVVAAAVSKLVDKMEAAAFSKPAQNKPAPVAAPQANASATLSKVGAWTWLTFATKPAQAVLDALSAAGWRWSHKRAAWYNLEGRLPPAGITYIEQSA